MVETNTSKNLLIAFDIDGTLKGYGGPVSPFEIESLKRKYFVGVISARGDYKEVSKALRMEFAYQYSPNVFAKIKKDFPNMKTYIYVTDNIERFTVAESAGWLSIEPTAVVGYGNNTTLLTLKVVLAAIMNVASLLDYYTTKKALEKGLKEANPLARMLMRWGWRKYQLFKWLLPIGYAAYAMTSEDPYYLNTAGLAIASATFIYATINNLLLIAGRERETETRQEQAQ
ncbi:MAG: DUF5658 family protein [Candidatus Bathyarchaeia archaeon]